MDCNFSVCIEGFKNSIESVDFLNSMKVSKQPKKTIIQDLSWSYDNEKIFFSAMVVNSDYSNYNPRLWSVYYYNLIKDTIVLVSKSAIYISISKQDELLAYSKIQADSQIIEIEESNGSLVYKFNNGCNKSFAPTWSPEGNFLAFNSEKNGIVEIYLWEKSTNKINQVTQNGKYKAYNPTWSPKGDRIAYYLEKGDGKDQIYMFDFRDSTARNITMNSYNNIFPSWKDENSIIYSQIDSVGNTNLIQYNLEKNDFKSVFDLNTFYARYSQDGSMIASIDNKKGAIIISNKKGYLIKKIKVF